MANRIRHYKLGNLYGLQLRADAGGGTMAASAVEDSIRMAMDAISGICGMEFRKGVSGLTIMVKNAENNPHRGTFTSGRIYLNSAIGGPKWPDKKWYGPLQAYKIMIHELGHWLGLSHSPDITSIMHPHARAASPNVGDITRLQAKFGPPGGQPWVAKPVQPKADADLKLVMRMAAKRLKRKYTSRAHQLDAIIRVVDDLDNVTAPTSDA